MPIDHQPPAGGVPPPNSCAIYVQEVLGQLSGKTGHLLHALVGDLADPNMDLEEFVESAGEEELNALIFLASQDRNDGASSPLRGIIGRVRAGLEK